jgi:hypothetical protein
MRFMAYLPVFLLVVIAAIFGWLAFEKPIPQNPLTLIKAADELIAAQDQTTYTKTLKAFREKVFTQSPTGYERTQRALSTLTTARDKAGRPVPDPGLREAVVADSIDVSNLELENRHFTTFLLSSLLFLLGASLFFLHARRASLLAESVERKIPDRPIGSFSQNLNSVLNQNRELQELVEKLQSTVISLNSEIRLPQNAFPATYKSQQDDFSSGHFTIRKETTGSNPDSLQFPSLEDSRPQETLLSQEDDIPDLFAKQVAPPIITDFGGTAILPPNPLPSPVPNPFQISANHSTSELQYTQYLLGLADNPDFPPGKLVFTIEIPPHEVAGLRRSYHRFSHRGPDLHALR